MDASSLDNCGVFGLQTVLIKHQIEGMLQRQRRDVWRPRPHRYQERSDAHDAHDARPVIGQDVQRHLGGHSRQRLHQEVSGTHPGFDRAEWVLDCLASLTHFFRMLIKPSLHSFENMLMFPSSDPSPCWWCRLA
jgi:hypothetical protein